MLPWWEWGCLQIEVTVTCPVDHHSAWSTTGPSLTSRGPGSNNRSLATPNIEGHHLHDNRLFNIELRKVHALIEQEEEGGGGGQIGITGKMAGSSDDFRKFLNSCSNIKAFFLVH